MHLSALHIVSSLSGAQCIVYKERGSSMQCIVCRFRIYSYGLCDSQRALGASTQWHACYTAASVLHRGKTEASMSSDDMEHREWYSLRGRMPLDLRRRLAQHQRRVEASAGQVGKSAILRGLLRRGLDAAETAEARELVQTAQPYRLDVRAESVAEWRQWGVYASQRRAEGAVQVAHRWSGVTHWRVVHAPTGEELSRGATDGE